MTPSLMRAGLVLTIFASMTPFSIPPRLSNHQYHHQELRLPTYGHAFSLADDTEVLGDPDVFMLKWPHFASLL